MKHRLSAIGLFICLGGSLGAQTTDPLAHYGYTLPVKIPVLLSSNCGELRANHFHSGIDIKTQGVIGKPVYAVADGYVSRVSVSPSGYGKAIYLQHPNGTTSVYGHVEQFYDSLEAYVYRQQYARHSFQLDLYFRPGQFPVAQGDLIALSGNRGSSGGPHLHFEIRDSEQRPYNLLAHNLWPVADTIPPRALSLYRIQIDTIQGIAWHRIVERIPLRRDAPGHYVPAEKTTLSIGSHGYFAVEVKEHKNGTHNVMGVYRIEQRIDGKENFALEIDRVPFHLTRYANAVTLYEETSKRNNIYRLFVLPNNPLNIYRNVLHQGLITLPDTDPHDVEIDLSDEVGNLSQIQFTLVRTQEFDSIPAPIGVPVLWWKDFRHQNAGLTVDIPARSLYESILFHAQERSNIPSYAYSPLYDIHTAKEPLQKAITVSIDADDLPAHLRDKAVLGYLSASGKRSSAGGKWNPETQRIEAKVRQFGTYYITADTIPPRIVPEFKSGADLSAQKSLSLKISDNFSGIHTYSATIDGQWALLEYDPKTNRITHVFDPTRWPQNQVHELKVKVTDNCGNQNTLITQYKH